jgi:hypothetical protein
MDILDRSGVYCSGLICAWPPLGFLDSFRGKDDRCTLWMVLKVHGEMRVDRLLVKHQILPCTVNLTDCRDSSYLLDLWVAREEVMGGQVNCQLPSGCSQGLEGKWWGKVNRPLYWTYPQGASAPEYYSIFLLQQEASALWNTVVINNNGILIHLSNKVLSCEKSAQESIFWKFTFVTLQVANW